MRRSISGLFLALSLLMGASALAANERRHKPSEYQEQEISDADRAAARERAKSKVTSWRETEMPPEYEFPWMQLGAVALAFVVATPFAIGAYNRHAAEAKAIAEASNTGPRKRTKPAAAAEE